MQAGIHQFLGRLNSLFRKRRKDAELAEELEFHQTLMREKLLRDGMPASEADRKIRQSFGSAARWHERLRELGSFAALRIWRGMSALPHACCANRRSYFDCAADSGSRRRRPHSRFLVDQRLAATTTPGS